MSALCGHFATLLSTHRIAFLSQTYHPYPVGYSNIDQHTGNQGVGAAFIAIGHEGKLGDLSITGYDPESGYEDCGVVAVKLDEFGRNNTEDMYWWDSPAYTDKKGKFHEAIKGWFDLDEAESFNDVPLAPGEGIWLTMPDDSMQVCSSGEVLNDTLPVTLQSGNTLCPNPVPKALTLGDVSVDGYDKESGYEDCEIVAVKLDEFGRNNSEDMYWWDSPAYTDKKGKFHEAICGWYDLDEAESFNEEPVAIGEAVWVAAPSDEFMIVWPNVLAK